MADTERPKRLRGAKQAEEFYRAGFLDGLLHGSTEAHEKRAIDAKRDDAVRLGLQRLREQMAAKPKRTRRTKVIQAASEHVASRDENGL